MATRWDQHTVTSLAALQDGAVRAHLRDVVAPFSPLWRQRFADLNRKADSVRSVADLAGLPALGERDVSPTGDPEAMATMVLQTSEAGYALHASGPELRHAMRLRLTRGDAYRRIVEADTRPTSYLLTGLGFRYPVASTRNDLDVITRAGARLWAVLGLTRNDVMVSAVPVAATIEHVGLEYAALGAGAPALFPGADPAAVAAAVRLAPPTVLAAPSRSAVELLNAIGPIPSLHTLLLVGAPSSAERIAATHALHRAGSPTDAAILAVHAPAGARVLWGECRQSGGTGGLHTYPDLDVVQVVDPETGDAAVGEGELVLTQLGLRGTALVRWRTGDVVESVTTDQCRSCGRTLARIGGLRRRVLVARLGGGRTIDLRPAAAALAARPDLNDWRIVAGRRSRDGAPEVLVYFVTPVTGDETQTAVGVATDIRAVAGSLPTQLVAASQWEIAALGGDAVSARILRQD